MKKAEMVIKKMDAVQRIFETAEVSPERLFTPQHEKGLAFAPTNIALCKYWGKRDEELNLPMTSSLSIALPEKGAMTTLKLTDSAHDEVILNGKTLKADTAFVTRLIEFINLIRGENAWRLHIDIQMNIPVAAGLASSACGFASIVFGLNDLFDWHLDRRQMSMLARLGSGSAARSFWTGFVEWHAGVSPDGMDCFAEPLAYEWPGLLIGILPVSDKEKPISSREAMRRTVNSSILYREWPKKVTQDMVILRQAIHAKNFSLLGGVAESNALTMHATMLSCWPPILYALPETIAAMHQVWQLRKEGVEVYFTQDAGPNLKLIFTKANQAKVMDVFPDLETISLFE